MSRVSLQEELTWASTDLDIAEIHWAAGFFDGEGTVFVVKRQSSSGPHAGEKPYLVVAVDQCYTDEELKRFKNAIGFPSVSIQGPHYSKSRKSPLYRFTVSGKRAHCVMQRLLPYLCSRKREKYIYLISNKGV